MPDPTLPGPPFLVATLSPVDLGASSMAVAAAKAGGVGLLDVVHASPARHVRALDNVEALVQSVPTTGEARVGIRLSARQVHAWTAVVEALAACPHWVVLADWSPESVATVLDELAHARRAIWLEVLSSDDLGAIPPSTAFAGWVGRGAESGGVTGRHSTFVLAQHLSRQRRPFLLSGGIGQHTAAACRAAGACGIVLDDAALLLRESPLPPQWRARVALAGLTDAKNVGEPLGRRVRVLDRPDLDGARLFRQQADALAAVGGSERSGRWDLAVEKMVGWDEPADRAWPVGEGIGAATALAASYGTVGRAVRGVASHTCRLLRLAAEQAALAEHAPLAAAHGTRYPVVQGPMTRVSDNVAFADAVARGGGLPLFALALMRGPEIAALLADARETLGQRPWGVGILGFVPDDLRREQLAAVIAAKPPFALVAGGRPNHATELESHGIATYLHVPAPLLRMYLDAGVRRFVFEGAECGGHIGPLHAFALWEHAVQELLQLSAPDARQTHVLFAGGIHDAVSSAMVAALAAPLVEKGMRVGVLMGTAYLFTEEAVACGAITPVFQEAALSGGDTVTISTAPGHVIRCVDTPFVGAFAREKAALAASGVAGHALQDALERLVVGRARVASKGLLRTGDALVRVDAGQQKDEGLFMLGDVGRLRQDRTTIASLHDAVSREADAWLRDRRAASPPDAERAEPPRPADVAIIGASCLMPGSSDVESFWTGLLANHCAITDVPADRWDARVYYDADPAARDRIASKWGGFVSPTPFEPGRYGIPPRSLPSITPPQLIALELTRRALLDAGFDDAAPPPDVRARTAVLLAAGNTGDLEQMYMTRAALPLVTRGDADALDRLPEWTEESYPGLLANVVAGRVANRFDFGGPNFTVDAACASSIAVLDLAVRELQDRRSDLVVTGGLEFEMSPQAFMGFSKTRALSPRGCADVFDQQADGIVMAEGGVVVVLKRLADAARDGDRVYAVIKAVAGSSDGRGMSLTAPKPEGQQVAMRRAYQAAGFSPATLGLYEAHGTGTALGDAAEVTTVTQVLADSRAGAGSCVVGSLKSLLGHTRTAAGMAALLKTALALHHRVRPPHAGVREPLPALEAADSPLRLLASPEAWLEVASHPRRAGVSAFGFGGTNFHAVLEEAPATNVAGDAPAGAATWSHELFVLGAANAALLDAQLARLERAAGALEQGGRPRLRDLAYSCAVTARGSFQVRVALVASSVASLREAVADARVALGGRPTSHPGVLVGEGSAAGTVGLLFPGQGSQHPGMGRELACVMPDLRRAVEHADRLFDGRRVSLSRVMWPGAPFGEPGERSQRHALAGTANAQPAIGTISGGMLDALQRLRVRYDAVAGHSYGELVALHAAGAFDRDDLLRLSAARGSAMASLAGDAGTMAAVTAPMADVETALGHDRAVAIANRNAPRQVVISGTTNNVRAASEKLSAAGYTVVALPVSAAFHSPLMAPARAGLRQALDRVALQRPTVPVFSNLDGRPFPADPSAIADRLLDQLVALVDFEATVEAMYDQGVRTFVEVGPGRVLSGLVTRILEKRPHAACPCDGGLGGWLELVGQLFARGHAVDVLALFEGRPVAWVDLERAPAPPSDATSWWLDGSRVWPMGSPRPSMGAAPFLDVDSATRPASPSMPSAATGAGASALVDVYAEYERTMRTFLDQQERMLRLMVDRADTPDHSASGGLAPSAPAEPSAPQRPVAPAQAERPATVDKAWLTAAVTRLMSERTGYAEGVLTPDADLEADLGIDSLKRIEIFVSLTRELPPSSVPPTLLDRLVRLRTLGAVVDEVAAALGRVVGPDGLDVPGSPRSPACPRSLMRAQTSRVDPQQEDVRLEGLHLVVGGRQEVALGVAARLRERGATPVVVPDLLAADDATRRIEWARREHGPAQGIVDLTGSVPARSDDLDGWREATRSTALGRLGLLHACADDLALRASRPMVLVTTMAGGMWGRGGPEPRLDASAASHGLLRSFVAEHPHVAACTVDLSPDTPVDDLVATLVTEYCAPRVDSEVGCVGGERVRFAAEVSPLDVGAGGGVPLPLADGTVVLATGGGAGITSAACCELAAPGVRFVLVGRRAACDPAVLEALHAKGARVEYHAVDVRDAPAFGALIDDVLARLGRLDGVLHGAGVIADQAFSQKDAATFGNVFDTKVSSLVTLARHLRARPPRWMVSFGSVSGRFGNQGQADYATANEALNRLSWHLHRLWPTTRVATINWGPWQGTGMAGDALIALLAARGIDAISVDAGCGFLVDELQFGRLDEVEVVAGNGPWTASEAAPRTRIDEMVSSSH